METVTEGQAGEHSDYGRHQTRGRRHRSLSSSSRSRSSNRGHRRKWSIQKYTVARKEVRKLNTYELIVDIEGLTVMDSRSFLEQSICAMHDHIKDSAHVSVVSQYIYVCKCVHHSLDNTPQ